MWWLGQSGFLLQWQGVHVLLDPYLSDSLTKKYSQTDKPHIRMTELVVDPARLSFADVVTSSHNHTDHLDAETLCPILAQNPHPKLVIAESNRDFVAERLGTFPRFRSESMMAPLLKSRAFEFLVWPQPTRLWSGTQGRDRFLGYVVQFGGWTVYHSGDTVRYPEMAEKLRSFRVRVALLPINGRAPEEGTEKLSGPEGGAAGESRSARDRLLPLPLRYV